MATPAEIAKLRHWLASTPDELPFRMVEYWPEDWPHGHNHFADLDESTEDIAEGLAQAILDCAEHKHGGRGRFHEHYHAEAAYLSAISQVLGNEDRKAYADLRRRVRDFVLWGGHAPELVLTPSQKDARMWDAIVKDPRTGLPTVYNTHADDIGLPDPRAFGARKHRLGPGWVTKDRQRPS